LTGKPEGKGFFSREAAKKAKNSGPDSSKLRALRGFA